jgi:hypothetical protein
VKKNSIFPSFSTSNSHRIAETALNDLKFGIQVSFYVLYKKKSLWNGNLKLFQNRSDVRFFSILPHSVLVNMDRFVSNSVIFWKTIEYSIRIKTITGSRLNKSCKINQIITQTPNKLIKFQPKTKKTAKNDHFHNQTTNNVNIMPVKITIIIIKLIEACEMK